MTQDRNPILAELAKARDGYRCVKCGWSIGWMLEVDHIIPLADGGLDVLDNLQTLCARCHAEKTRLENIRRSMFRIGY